LQQHLESLKKEPVTIKGINREGIRNLLKNESANLRMINIWATWCAPCLREFPDLVSINRMYRQRAFELITICADNPAARAKALGVLNRFHVSTTNYMINTGELENLLEQLDPKWKGGLPFTIILEPGGNIIYARHGGIQPMHIKKKIVDHPLMGRHN
jgi:thiol-disulfide isomerase/thioredoxin